MKDKQAPERRRPGNVPGSRPTLNAYYSSRGDQSSSPSPFKKVSPKKVLRKAWLKAIDYLFFTIVGVLLILSLIVTPHARVVLNDSTYHSQKDYENFISIHIQKLADRNKVSFNEQELVAAIHSAFPEVQLANVELPIIGQRPVVSLNVAQPAFFISYQGNQYLLSGNGVAVDLKSFYPHLASLEVIDDNSGFVITKGKHVLSQQDISFLESISAQLKQRGVPVEKLSLPRAPEEVDLYTKDAPYYTKFFMGGDAGLQAGQFLAARNNFKSQTPPDQYLDVRVSGKVFFK